MAPGTAAQPQESPAPSSAGPAAVEQHNSLPSCHSASSPFVPISMRRDGRLFKVMPLASAAQVMSAPTKGPIQRGRYRLTPLRLKKSKSSEESVSPNGRERVNGARDKGAVLSRASR